MNLQDWRTPPRAKAEDVYDALVANRFEDAKHLMIEARVSPRIREHIEASRYQDAICALEHLFPRHTRLTAVDYVLAGARAE